MGTAAMELLDRHEVTASDSEAELARDEDKPRSDSFDAAFAALVRGRKSLGLADWAEFPQGE